MPSKAFNNPISTSRRYFVQFDDGSTSSSTLDTGLQFGESRTTSWTNTPGFKSLRSHGQSIPDQNYSLEWLQFKGGAGIITTPFSGGVQIVSYVGHQGIGYATHDPSIDLDVLRLNSQLISRMKGQQWNAPVFVAEAHKTVAMVVQRAGHLARLANMLRLGNLVGFVRELRDVAAPSKRRVNRWKHDFYESPRAAAGNAWLEYSYGWRPFVKDVYDATMTLMDVMEQPARTQGRVTAKMKSEYYLLRESILLFSDSVSTVYGRSEIVGKGSIRATWSFRPNSLDLPARLGLLNPLEVIWELVPFSFVADWFLPIGDYLAALDVPARVDFVSGCYGKRKQTIMYNSTSQPGVSGFTGHGTNVSVSRTPMSGNPSIDLNNLSFSAGLNSGRRIASAISLLNQQVSRFKR